MAIVCGGITSEFGAARAAHLEVMREIRSFAPRDSEDEYAVDIAVLTGDDLGPDPTPLGVSPGPVGRAQRRFIIWHRLPKGLSDPDAVRRWFVDALPETEVLVRTYLPSRSKAYPADELARQVADLRSSLAASLG